MKTDASHSKVSEVPRTSASVGTFPQSFRERWSKVATTVALAVQLVGLDNAGATLAEKAARAVGAGDGIEQMLKGVGVAEAGGGCTFNGGASTCGNGGRGGVQQRGGNIGDTPAARSLVSDEFLRNQYERRMEAATQGAESGAARANIGTDYYGRVLNSQAGSAEARARVETTCLDGVSDANGMINKVPIVGPLVGSVVFGTAARFCPPVRGVRGGVRSRGGFARTGR